jgi:hypothetical protein
MVHRVGGKSAFYGTLKMGAAGPSGAFLSGTGFRGDISSRKYCNQTRRFENRRNRVGFFKSLYLALSNM